MKDNYKVVIPFIQIVPTVIKYSFERFDQAFCYLANIMGKNNQNYRIEQDFYSKRLKRENSGFFCKPFDFFRAFLRALLC